MRLSDKDTETVDELMTNVELDTLKGAPEEGHKSTIDEEQWRKTIARASIREAVREVSEAYVDLDEQMDNETHPRVLFALENIDKIYLSQYPWRCPFMAIELEECPDWAQITVAKTAQVRDHPKNPREDDVVYFQVREGL